MRILVTMLVFSVVFACSKKDEEPPPMLSTTTTTVGPAGEARQLFDTVCYTCHGKDGTGTGPASATLNPKPRNYTDKAWQASVTDDAIKNIILGGGLAVGKSPIMPAQTQLKDKPEVVNELVKIVRAFGK